MASKTTIECTYKDESALFRSYMPFVKGGGLFVRTSEPFKMGQAVTLSIRLPEGGEQFSVAGKVIWYTPEGAQGNKPAGIGVQFPHDAEGRNLCNRIETLLAGMLKSNQSTDTI